MYTEYEKDRPDDIPVDRVGLALLGWAAIGAFLLSFLGLMAVLMVYAGS